jgi:hypothetical protein
MADKVNEYYLASGFGFALKKPFPAGLTFWFCWLVRVFIGETVQFIDS